MRTSAGWISVMSDDERERKSKEREEEENIIRQTLQGWATIMSSSQKKPEALTLRVLNFVPLL